MLVALVWTQFAIAEHGHDHALDDLSHICGICQQLDSGDSVIAAIAPIRSAHPAVVSAASARDATASAEPFPHYNARASP